MLTTQELTDLLAQPVTQVTRGRAMAMRQRAGNGSQAATAQQRLLDDYRAAPIEPPETYPHPAAPPVGNRKDKGPLTQAETTWLTRTFPPGQDPATVPHQDARALAALGSGVSPVTDPADARLVASIWDPIKAHHDGRQAQVAIRNARPQPPIPTSALPALAATVGAENPGLRPDEAIGRAGELVRTAADRREQARQDAIASAKHTQKRVAAASHDRTAPTPFA